MYISLREMYSTVFFFFTSFIEWNETIYLGALRSTMIILPANTDVLLPFAKLASKNFLLYSNLITRQ